MKVYVAIFENAFDGGIMTEVFSTREAAESCRPYAEIEEHTIAVDELVKNLDASDRARLQEKLK